MILVNRVQELIYEKQSREKRDVPADEIANAVGMSRQNVYRWINNEVKVYPAATLSAFCRYFPCKIEELLVFVEEYQEKAHQ